DCSDFRAMGFIVHNPPATSLGSHNLVRNCHCPNLGYSPYDMGTNSHSLHHPLPLSFGRAASLWGKGIHAMKLRKKPKSLLYPNTTPSLKAAPFLFALKVIVLNN